MRVLIGVFAILFALITAAEAQYQNRYYPTPPRNGPQYGPQYQAAPIQEDCPQGRQLRAQKAYPASMTDCQVLDAAVENQKLQRKRALPKAVAATSAPTAPAPANATPPPKPPNVTPPVAAAPATSQQVAAPPPAPSARAPATTAAEESAAVPADYEGRAFGNWMTSGTFDRFGDGGSFVAVTTDGQIGLAVRCLQKDLTLGVIEGGADPKPLEKSQVFTFRIRVDGQPVITTLGAALSERLIQIVTDKSWVKAMRDGRETAVRMEDMQGVSSTHVFPMAGARRAFADLSRECPLE